MCKLSHIRGDSGEEQPWESNRLNILYSVCYQDLLLPTLLLPFLFIPSLLLPSLLLPFLLLYPYPFIPTHLPLSFHSYSSTFILPSLLLYSYPSISTRTPLPLILPSLLLLLYPYPSIPTRTPLPLSFHPYSYSSTLILPSPQLYLYPSTPTPLSFHPFSFTIIHPTSSTFILLSKLQWTFNSFSGS